MSMTSVHARSLDNNFRQARHACDHSGPAMGFELLCSVLENVLASRSELVSGEALRLRPIQPASLGILYSESGFKLRLLSAKYSRNDCETLISDIAAFVASLPPMTFAERIEVRARRWSERCMDSDRSLPAKRRRLRLLARIRLLMLQRQASPGRQLQYQQALLGYLLHEPNARVSAIWREHLFWFHFNFAKRLLHIENRSESDSYLRGFGWSDRGDYHRLIHKSQDSRVLASIHMGDFFGAFRVIAQLSDTGRGVISLRREITTNHGMQHFSAERISHSVFYHQQHEPAAIVSALRRGQHTLAILFDLRGDFGSTVVVNFFGHRARFVKGPAQLAILGRSNIIPFVSFESRGRNCIEMAPVIDTRIHPGESLEHATVRITQALVNLAEGWIRRWPEQWKYLPALPAYLEAPS